jgi:hypothetical protein
VLVISRCTIFTVRNLCWLLPLSISFGCTDKTDSMVADDTGDEPRAEAEAHTWDEYRVPNRTDDVACSGVANDSATIGPVYLAQTHPMSPDWPFFFLVADRPALAEVIVTGGGDAPEVSITASIDGEVLETLCLAGPEVLAELVETEPHNREDRFTVTMPNRWMTEGLSLEITAGPSTIAYDAETLGLLHAPELNMMLVMMDVLNYNHEEIDTASFNPPPEFLDNLGNAMPTAVNRLGVHAARIKLPTFVVGSTMVEEGTPPLVLTQRLCNGEESSVTHDCDDTTLVGDWDINAASLRVIDAIQRANGHWASHYYYGHTGGLFPGGWGGGKTFVSADYQWVTIHELGHAASLPHWGDNFLMEEQDDGWYEYPWGGESFDGGGRGPTWTYLQHEDRFVSTICQEEWNEDNFGLERSDAMQRTHSCSEWWDEDSGPWDGFSDFSAYAMFRFMNGATTNQRGWVTDPLHGEIEYNLPAQGGFPVMEWGVENPEYTRPDPDIVPQNWEQFDFLTPQQRNVPVYTIYGSYHPGYPESNVMYEPLYYVGDLPRVLDPTDPATFNDLALGMDGPYADYFWWAKDLTFKITYEDGSILHALDPHDGTAREWEEGFGPWRWDLTYFGINVPADQPIARVQMFLRPFLVRYPDWIDEGNIGNPDFGITAENFMDDAIEILDLEL